MKIFLPNSANLGNIEAFARKLDFEGPKHLIVSAHPRWVTVHPIVLAATAALSRKIRRDGGSVTSTIGNVSTAPYLSRMRLFDFLGVSPPVKHAHHEAAGRFIPISVVEQSSDLSAVLANIVPLLHGQADSEALRYVLSELVTNVFEHSQSPLGALICFQYYRRSNRLALGVADVGVGLRTSIGNTHGAASDERALQLALRPGISGRTPRIGGTSENAGAGLFYTKALAHTGGSNFVIYSGQSLFKLRRAPTSDRNLIQVDPVKDRATWRNDLPSWPGTLVGVDFSLDNHQTFNALLRMIGRAYSSDVKTQRKSHYKKKPRFQ
jgi:anti-sigma regulatory factor (Ser/Thr protein kinase)